MERTQRARGGNSVVALAVASPRFSLMASRSTRLPTMPSTTTKTAETYRLVPAAPKASLMSTMMCLPNSTPASAKMPSTTPSLMSTCPYLLRLWAPTRALGNLWAMLLATATTPGTPRLIMAGVRTKAPPEPMKPLTMPPTKPTRNRMTAVV